LVVFSNFLLIGLDINLSFFILLIFANLLYQAPLLFLPKKGR
jgi:hypothetical protein